ncbi:acetyltransferase-like isoleucine patch superfamily enzyme [Pseudomonas putida]|nr:CatB-related O-acetyltransferase [Pseudomonas putida]MCS4065613.1 acetyltransferase-like isoleucine patch superfamily enzyme [Pseudomonas putida]
MPSKYPSHGVKYNSANIKGTLLAESPSSMAAVVKSNCSIGYLSYTGRDSEIFNTQIGRFCSIAPGFVSGPTNHPTDRLSSHLFSFANKGPFDGCDEFADWMRDPPLESNEGKVMIGHDVWIGRNVTVKRGVKIGTGSIIGAGSIITKDIAPYSIVGGAPAKLIRMRFSEKIIESLLDIQWHKYDLRKSVIENFNPSDVESSIALLRELIDNKSIRTISCPRYKITTMGLEEITKR